MICLYKNLFTKDHDPLAVLKNRVEQNYADFKAETLLLLNEEEIYEMAHSIAAVKDTYEQLINDSDYLGEEEIAFLLKFHNPLEMAADFLQMRLSEYPVEIDDALMELFNADDHEESYLTVDFAEELTSKYGEDVRIKVALLLETIEAGEKYVRLLKLTDKADADDVCDCSELTKPFKPFLFDEDGFFIYEDDEEGCF
jgi:hypothetical protein